MFNGKVMSFKQIYSLKPYLYNLHLNASNCLNIYIPILIMFDTAHCHQ